LRKVVAANGLEPLT